MNFNLIYKLPFFLFLCLLLFTKPLEAQESSESKSFLETYPHLEKFHYEPPKSNVFFGIGLSPIGMMPNKVSVSLSLLQIHYRKWLIDWEVFNGSYIRSISQNPLSRSEHVIFWTSPKIQALDFLSFGPLIGYEFVSFPNTRAVIRKNKYATPVEPFSSQGIIYGASVSETFSLGNDYLLKVSQIFFRETYSTEESSFGWNYVYRDEEIQDSENHKPIRPGDSFLVQFSVLF